MKALVINNEVRGIEERDINVKFPEDYGSADLKGKDAVFTVTLRAILPTLP